MKLWQVIAILALAAIIVLLGSCIYEHCQDEQYRDGTVGDRWLNSKAEVERPKAKVENLLLPTSYFQQGFDSSTGTTVPGPAVSLTARPLVVSQPDKADSRGAFDSKAEVERPKAKVKNFLLSTSYFPLSC